MAYTSHGHHIKGSSNTSGLIDITQVARCGGPGLCAKCSRESAMYRHPTNYDNRKEEQDGANQ